MRVRLLLFLSLADYFSLLDRRERERHVLLNYTRITFDFYTLSKRITDRFRRCLWKEKKRRSEMNISRVPLFSNGEGEGGGSIFINVG